MTIQPAGSRSVVLVEQYRGSPPGSVLELSPELARRLVAQGVAAYGARPRPGRAVPERAVGPAVECRGSTP